MAPSTLEPTVVRKGRFVGSGNCRNRDVETTLTKDDASSRDSGGALIGAVHCACEVRLTDRLDVQDDTKLDASSCQRAEPVADDIVSRLRT